MIAVPVFNTEGARTGEIQVEPAVFGGKVRARLIKQAVVAYLNHQRLYSARTKGRGESKGSTRKLYRQKGTGNARAGNRRTPIRRGGGRTFAQLAPRAHVDIPKKMRQGARDSAILAKLQAGEVLVVDGFRCDRPRTKEFSGLLLALKVDRGCVFAVEKYDRNAYLSARNLSKTDLCVIDDLNAYSVLRRPKIVFTKPAFVRLEERARSRNARPAE